MYCTTTAASRSRTDPPIVESRSKICRSSVGQAQFEAIPENHCTRLVVIHANLDAVEGPISVRRDRNRPHKHSLAPLAIHTGTTGMAKIGAAMGAKASTAPGTCKHKELHVRIVPALWACRRSRRLSEPNAQRRKELMLSPGRMRGRASWPSC